MPTGVAMGPDGALYVSLLSGGPFPPGAAKIMRVGMSGNVGDVMGGFSMLTDIKWGPDGAWYVVQFAEFNLQGNPPGFTPNSGAIWRIGANGARTMVAGGLMFPNKIAFDRNGSLYATVGTLGPQGQVWRWDNVAAGAGGTTPGMPRTGESMPVADLAYIGLLLVLGAALRLGAPRLAAWRRG